MATSQPTPTQAPKAKPYRALTPIEHDGKRFEIDKTLRLDDEAAAPLLAVKAIAAAGKDAETE